MKPAPPRIATGAVSRMIRGAALPAAAMPRFRRLPVGGATNSPTAPIDDGNHACASAARRCDQASPSPARPDHEREQYSHSKREAEAHGWVPPQMRARACDAGFQTGRPVDRHRYDSLVEEPFQSGWRGGLAIKIATADHRGDLHVVHRHQQHRCPINGSGADATRTRSWGYSVALFFGIQT
jgi:hypothetical protein